MVKGLADGHRCRTQSTVHSCNHITMLLHVPLMDHSSRPAILICVNSKLVTSQTSSLQSPAAACMYSVTMPSLLPTLHSNSDVSVTIQPPSSVKGCTKHSEGINNVMTVHYSLSIHVHIHHAHPGLHTSSPIISRINSWTFFKMNLGSVKACSSRARTS